METIIIYLMIAFCWFLEYIVPPLAVIGSIVMCVIVYGHAEEHPEDY